MGVLKLVGGGFLGRGGIGAFSGDYIVAVSEWAEGIVFVTLRSFA